MALPLLAHADELSLDKFDESVRTLELSDPMERDPLSMSTTLVASRPGIGDNAIAVMKLRLLPGWHIYASVPPDQPFIETKWILEHGPELTPADDWATPPSTLHKQFKNTRIYESSTRDLLFFRKMKVADDTSGEAPVTIGLRYQICDNEYCLPPRMKTQSHTLKLIARKE